MTWTMQIFDEFYLHDPSYSRYLYIWRKHPLTLNRSLALLGMTEQKNIKAIVFGHSPPV